MRINRLSEAFKKFFDLLFSGYCPEDCDMDTSLMDSLPIISCSGKRSPSIAKELTVKGFCSNKSMYYYGLKLHALAFHRPEHLPFPESIVIIPASENDLNVHRQNWSDISNRSFYGDKICYDAEQLENMDIKYNSTILTPLKAVKGQSEITRQCN